jgi:hypothetical protein
MGWLNAPIHRHGLHVSDYDLHTYDFEKLDLLSLAVYDGACYFANNCACVDTGRVEASVSHKFERRNVLLFH